MKIYQVVAGYYFYMETQEITYGYYSTNELAEKRKQEVIKKYDEDAEHMFIYEITVDKDMKK